MAASAQDRVLDTVELFENILSNLDIQHLLICQRVNKHTKAIIDSSTILQQTLFFALAPVDTGRTFGRDGFNPLITGRPQLFRDPTGVTILIESYMTYEYTPEIVGTRHCTFKIDAEDIHGAETRPQSWQRMFLVQAPHKMGRLRLRLLGREAVSVHVPGLVTCGEMFRLLARALGQSGTESRVDGVIKQAAESAL